MFSPMSQIRTSGNSTPSLVAGVMSRIFRERVADISRVLRERVADISRVLRDLRGPLILNTKRAAGGFESVVCEFEARKFIIKRARTFSRDNPAIAPRKSRDRAAKIPRQSRDFGGTSSFDSLD